MATVAKENKITLRGKVDKAILLEAYQKMCVAKSLTELYEENKAITAKYVHATSRGHEAVQLALSMQLKPQDYVSPYYRDDSILLGIGITPFELMLQVLAKRSDIFSGGRTYYSHPSLNREDMPKIPHQSSATGMQAIPTTGIAMGIQYKELTGLTDYKSDDEKPVVVCSLGDASCTEGEVAEAFQMAALKQMPVIYLVQDNEWDISAKADEIRAQDISEYAKGFKGIEVRLLDGTNFSECYNALKDVIAIVRKERRPFIIHAKVPLLNHHTSGVRMEWYRDDLEEASKKDPFPKLQKELLEVGVVQKELDAILVEAQQLVEEDYQRSLAEEDPRPEDLTDHIFAPTPITEEKGIREPAGKEKTVMVDSALFAIRELMTKHPECLLYGQDVGERLGGVFREAATLAETFGDDRVFNTPIQEAFIIGSTVGMSVAGLKPIVEVQFADYIWPGLNQLFTEVSRSYYLSNGKWPVSMILRVPIGAYGSGGPYHSSSVESVVTLEHKGLYWSKIKGTEGAMTVEPDADYVIPFGKARTVLEANPEKVKNGESLAIITYGRGVYWSLEAEKQFQGQVEIIDLRTLNPLDEDAMYRAARKHGKIMVVTEESVECAFSLGLMARIQKNCFKSLDAPVEIVGSVDTPAIPLNSTLEFTLLPSGEKVATAIGNLLDY